MHVSALFRRLRESLTPIAAALLLSGLVVTGAIAPAAAVAGAHPAGAGLERGTGVWYGHVQGAGGERWYCGDPSAGGRYLAEPFHEPGTGYSEIAHTSTWTPASDGGRPMDPDAVRTLAHLLATHAVTDDDQTAAAVAWAIRTLTVSGGGTGDATPAGDDLAAAGQALIDDSHARRGPYVVRPVLKVDAAGATATVSDYTARSEATGAAIQGVATLTIEGPAVFASTGGASVLADGAPVEVVSIGTGRIAVTSVVAGLPADHLSYRTPTSPGFQRMLVAGQRIDVSGAAAADVVGFPDARVAISSTMLREGDTPVFPSSPDDDTVAFADSAGPGDRVLDAIWLDGALWRDDLSTGFAGPVTAELVRLAPGAVDGPIVARVTIDVDTTDEAHWETAADGTRRTRRDAPYLTPAVTLPPDARPGERFSWRIHAPEWSEATNFGGARQSAVTVPPGVVTETTTIDRGRPQFATQVSDPEVSLGESVTDIIAVDGMWSGARSDGSPASIDVVWKVYGPYRERPEPTDWCDESLLAGSGTLTVAANGTIETPPFTPAAPGHYTYVTESPQTSENHAAATPCGVPSETTNVVTPERAVLPDTGVGSSFHWLAVVGFGLIGSGGLVLGHGLLRSSASTTTDTNW